MSARPKWVTSSASWSLLLSRLDPNPAQASARYVALRRRLETFFTWRGCATAEELADETLDRLLRRLDEGELIDNIEAYAGGVARRVLWEVRKGRSTRLVPLDPETVDQKAVDDDEPPWEPLAEHLELCLAQLAPEDRELILEYYRDEDSPGTSRIVRRRDMAARLGVEPHILRARLFRLRERLERCVRARLEAPPAPPSGSARSSLPYPERPDRQETKRPHGRTGR